MPKKETAILNAFEFSNIISYILTKAMATFQLSNPRALSNILHFLFIIPGFEFFIKTNSRMILSLF